MCHRGIPNPSERVKLCVAGWMSVPLLTRLARATRELSKGFRDVGVFVHERKRRWEYLRKQENKGPFTERKVSRGRAA